MGCVNINPKKEAEYVDEDIVFKTKFERVIHKLQVIKSKENDHKEKEEIDWMIETLQSGDLFETDIVESAEQDNNVKIPQLMDYLSQFSEMQQKTRLRADHEFKRTNTLNKDADKYTNFIGKFKRSMVMLISSLEKDKDLTEEVPPESLQHLASAVIKVHSFDFDVFAVDKIIGKKTLLLVAQQIFVKYDFFASGMLQESKFRNFVSEVAAGYSRNVAYHNDLHGSDVLQTVYMLLEKGELIKKCHFDDLDVLSTLVAALCHDYMHNGFNNVYHVNVQSDIAIRYNDISVLENYHVSETFKTMLKKENNIFENLKPEEYRIARRRIIDGILATDMATHAKNLTALKSKLETSGIANGDNLDKLLASDNAAKNYENGQAVLSMCIHAADLSNPAKTPEVYDCWVDMLFKEFFHQGEVEKAQHLPVSMLCDRTTTAIPETQVGFINFIVLPQFEIIKLLAPAIQPYLDQIHANLKRKEELCSQNIANN